MKIFIGFIRCVGLFYCCQLIDVTVFARDIYAFSLDVPELSEVKALFFLVTYCMYRVIYSAALLYVLHVVLIHCIVS